MESMFCSKLALLEAALNYREDMTEYRRRQIFDGIFWLVDELEEEIRAQHRSDENYCMSHILELKEEIEKCFKSTAAFADSKTVMMCCTKLLSCAPPKE